MCRELPISIILLFFTAIFRTVNECAACAFGLFIRTITDDWIVEVEAVFLLYCEEDAT